MVSAQQCDQPLKEARFDCHPESSVSERKCLARKCCWKPVIPFITQLSTNHSIDAVELNVPWCFYPRDFPTYQIKTNESTPFGQRLTIIKQQSTYMPNEILSLTVDLFYETAQRFRLRIYDPTKKRYEVPLSVPVIQTKVNVTDYEVIITQIPFAILVKRKSNGVVLFDSSVSPLIYADQFIRFSSYLSSPFLYGFGEHRQPFLINVTNEWRKLTFWTRDFPPLEHINLYGVHPFHINIEPTANFHGHFFLNSNAMDIDLQPLPAITYTTIGGIIDLYLFAGPTAQDVIQQYWEVIGKPLMPPYWSLGFHLCRYGYNSIEKLRTVIQRMHDAEFPYDVQWTDIDAMSSHLDYTYDKINFNGLPDLVRALQSEGKHYVNIIDPGISSTQPSGTYPPYDDGLKKAIFMTKFNSTEPIIGKVWPGLTAFPDFTNENSIEWWTNIAATFHDTVPFDGIWIDMNEPSNFVDGSQDGCTNNSLDNPPFIPHVLGDSLSAKTLCPSAEHALSSHYNLHNMYGYFEARATNLALKTIRRKRPFVLSRSSFSGSGQYTAHWTGDNRATHTDMYFSISAILSFNMFGIPNVGADVCGFELETTEELCTRWMQLGAFYPFMRNHNDLNMKDQDPAVFSWKAQQIMKQALIMRYSLAPFWYTLHHQATMISRTLVQPLHFEFPNDDNTVGIDKQFLIGRAILVSPVLFPLATKVRAYIPQDVWYEFPSGIKITTVGIFTELDAPLDKINVHVRGGFIIPMQIPGDNLMMGRGNPFTLLVAQSMSGNATGNLFWDDGDSLDSIETKNYNYFEFSCSSNILTINATVANYKDSPMNLELIRVLGVAKTVTRVTVNGKNHENFSYNIFDQILVVHSLDLDMLALSSQTIQWTTTTTRPRLTIH
ncbi:unnamed protein product [Adineta steineri]|uniref:P-type domain-containing protein n=1 Tax=Adineta steineri TaxID=433720 RepID=A0A818T5I6_9BILA|nr:unnamed protein product [Adineta steineri]CAF3680346.1 unnamed protein product [Adineta steineri]CAF3843583.1 unnamed protein product [Adineta steineri]